ncbi:AAA family ATPase [Endozoicomonas sp. Mp262]
MSRETLPVDLNAVSDSYQYIVIDGAPAADKLAAAALKVADLVILPVTPSAYDVWATADLVDLIKTRQEVSGGSPESAFIISRAIKKSLIGDEVSLALSDYDLPILSSRTTNLLAYPTAAGRGQSVLLERYSQAKEEIMTIKNEIKDKYL